MLASFRLEAERICGCSGERQFAEIYLGSKSIVEILGDKIQNVLLKYLVQRLRVSLLP